MTFKRRTLIFDVDGTLLDSTYHHAMAWYRALRACALDVPMWRVHRAIGMGGDRLVSELCGDLVEDKMGDVLRKLWDEAYEEVRADVQPLPGARTLLEKLSGEGHRLGVATSGSREDTDNALDIVGVRGLVEVVVTSDDADADGSKPAPDVIEVCWKRLGGGPAKVVGDTGYDVAAAEAVGLPCIAVLTGGIGTEELRAAGAILVVDELTVLVEQEWDALIA